MSKDVEDFVRWYKKRRCKFSSEIYLNRNSRAKAIFLPYNDWDSSEILNKEISLNVNVFSEIRKRIDNKELTTSIPTIILALKNRAEYISSQSDFYPVFAALTSFLFALLGKYFINLLDLSSSPAYGVAFQGVMALFFTVVIIYTIYTRVETRRELSYCKELINILEFYEKQYYPRSKTDNAPALSKDENGVQSSHQLPTQPA
ncbi:hypothetical protein D3C78_1359900 [compost metagenome]